MSAPQENRPPADPSSAISPPTLPYQAPALEGAPGADVSKSLPVQAAKYSVYSGLFAFLIDFFSKQGATSMPKLALLGIALLCLILIVSGFVMGIVALVRNRATQYPGVTSYASAGIAINGIMLLMIFFAIIAMVFVGP